jgi:hypothetical protein
LTIFLDDLQVVEDVYEAVAAAALDYTWVQFHA